MMPPRPHLRITFLANMLRQAVNNMEHKASGVASLESFDYSRQRLAR
jgi:hypothetical protein